MTLLRKTKETKNRVRYENRDEFEKDSVEAQEIIVGVLYFKPEFFGEDPPDFIEIDVETFAVDLEPDWDYLSDMTGKPVEELQSMSKNELYGMI